ncbi:MAG: hypothetical protein JO326_12245, partial [Acetobacteraceae bacterium]|nr:hypothetical protein [Acetobacteraceae bacterium]
KIAAISFVVVSFTRIAILYMRWKAGLLAPPRGSTSDDARSPGAMVPRSTNAVPTAAVRKRTPALRGSLQRSANDTAPTAIAAASSNPHAATTDVGATAAATDIRPSRAPFSHPGPGAKKRAFAPLRSHVDFITISKSSSTLAA